MELEISKLLNAYRNGKTTPAKVIRNLQAKAERTPSAIWISKVPDAFLEKILKRLEKSNLDELPLYGIPFAIKDNIDCEETETTAGCPAYAYKPGRSAFAVQKLIDAGAIPLGKTNMDQFATGLVGVRSPYGNIPNRYAPEYISGGSSSGSAAAVAYGLCSFSLGTDTAGSGRVPAAFNNLVGVKPTCGLVSSRGVVPACRSLDCISIFANNLSDASRILKITKGPDPEDDYSREAPLVPEHLPSRWTFGIPEESELQFFGNEGYRETFEKAVSAAIQAGGTPKRIHYAPFLEAAKLLYEGAWVFERYAAVGKFIETHPDQIHPVIKAIILPKVTPHPAQIFEAFHSLRHYKKLADAEISQVDFLLTPTAGTCYKTEDVEADPIKLNSNLGYYTNYMNLLNYAALAIPAGFSGKLPFGITLVSRAFSEQKLFEAAGQITPYLAAKITLAVCGAHLRGEPLHEQLESADFLGKASTAAEYAMFALSGELPKPALVRVPQDGKSFYVELYALSPSEFGEFVSKIPAPLGIGKIKLKDGREVCGFLGESITARLGKDISEYGDWRKFIRENSL